MPQSIIVRLYGNYIFSFINDWQSFPNNYNILHSHQQCMCDPASLHLCQCVRLSLFLHCSLCGKCVVVSHSSFNLHFLSRQWYWKCFQVHIYHLQILFIEIFVSFDHFLIRVLFTVKFLEIFGHLDTGSFSARCLQICYPSL